MAVKKITGSMSVVDAARSRILNAFANGVKVYMSFSAGKDSLCMAHIVYDFILQGRIDPRQLVVLFVDEEAIYDSMEAMALRWRKRFVDAGAEFRWYCLPLKQVSGFHQLQNDESWITWEPGKEDCWVRDVPPFAITRSPYLRFVGEMNYQSFCSLVTKDGIQLVGVRASESIQRTHYLATVDMSRGAITGRNAIYPIYDWKDADVWLYIREHRLDFPDAYIELYRAGQSKRQLRLSNFFGADSCNGLRTIAETNPRLWERIQRREPNAYLTLLYWDSEMFKRATPSRRKLEGSGKKDYDSEIHRLLYDEFQERFTNAARQKVGNEYRKFYVRFHDFMNERDFKKMYEALIAGDPKLRSLRALYISVFQSYADTCRADTKRREADARA